MLVSLMVDSDRERCQYRACQLIATAVVIIELGPAPIKRRLCDQHQGRAKAIARQHRAVAYRLVPL